MTDELLTKDVLIDVSVNIIPLGIILLLFGLLLFVNPWHLGISVTTVVKFLPILIGFIGLAVLTYVGALKIET